MPARTPRIALALLTLALAAPALAEDEPAAPAEQAPPQAPAPHWEFTLAPHLWAVGMKGNLSAERVSADVDVTFSDIWDALDWGALAQLEARRGKLSLAANVVGMKLSTEASHPVSPRLPVAPPGSFDVRLTNKTWIVELRPGWEVLSLPLFDATGERRVAFDVGPTARVWVLDNHLNVKLQPGVPVGPFERRFDETTDWVDFGLGARARARLTEHIGLVVSGDYGGFDIGSSSHRTWSVAAFASYRLGEHWDLAGGWRQVAIRRGGVALDLTGPLLGVMFHF